MKVKVLRDEPAKEDELGIHERLANVLVKLVDQITKETENNAVSRKFKNVIGLFGVWGSGKSTIINILKEKTKRKYKVFVFDSWSHKDDFIKRAFLINLASYLGLNKEIYNENEEDKDVKPKLGDYLTHRISKSKIEKSAHPKISFPLFIILLLIILNLLGIRITDFTENLSLRNIPLNYLILGAVVFILTCIFIFNKNWFSQFITPFLEGTSDVTTNQLTMENIDFSAFEYQKMLNFILKKHLQKNKNQPLVVVLDNLDRVNDEMILRFITLMQSAIEGLEEAGRKIVFIVPIDRNRLVSMFSKLVKLPFANEIIKEVNGQKASARKEEKLFAEDFIEKLFPYQVELPNIKYHNWRSFFRRKFREAFGEIKVENFDLELELIIRIFSKGIEIAGENLTPREIINFINLLAINYLYWKDKIDIVNQAVFVAINKYNKSFTIEENEKWKDNQIVKEVLGYKDEELLYRDLLQQKYKTERVEELIYKDSFIRSLEKGDFKGINKIIDKIKESEKRMNIIRLAFNELKQALESDIKTLGNAALSIFEMRLTSSEKAILKRDFKIMLKNLLNNPKAKFDTLDEKVGRGIGILLKELNQKKLREEVVKRMVKTIIKLANQSRRIKNE